MEYSVFNVKYLLKNQIKNIVIHLSLFINEVHLFFKFAVFLITF